MFGVEHEGRTWINVLSDVTYLCFSLTILAKSDFLPWLLCRNVTIKDEASLFSFDFNFHFMQNCVF